MIGEELDWEKVKANLDRLTEEALADLAIRIINILEERAKAK
jgi:hypothetical protein